MKTRGRAAVWRSSRCGIFKYFARLLGAAAGIQADPADKQLPSLFPAAESLWHRHVVFAVSVWYEFL